MKPTTMRWAVNGDLVLLVEGAEGHSDVEWKTFVDVMAACMKLHDGRIRTLVLTDGAGPNAGQRQMAIKAGWENNKSPVAVVSKSMLVRGIITAFGWYNMNIRSFPVHALADAHRFLSLTPLEVQWAKAQAARLRSMLEPAASESTT
jgi:hypothetical protein